MPIPIPITYALTLPHLMHTNIMHTLVDPYPHNMLSPLHTAGDYIALPSGPENAHQLWNSNEQVIADVPANEELNKQIDECVDIRVENIDI